MLSSVVLSYQFLMSFFLVFGVASSIFVLRPNSWIHLVEVFTRRFQDNVAFYKYLGHLINYSFNIFNEIEFKFLIVRVIDLFILLLPWFPLLLEDLFPFALLLLFILFYFVFSSSSPLFPMLWLTFPALEVMESLMGPGLGNQSCYG